jgi:hypothetical protein
VQTARRRHQQGSDCAACVAARAGAVSGAVSETVMREAVIIALACFLILVMTTALIIHFVAQ